MKTMLITGATRGIGAETARIAASSGAYELILTARTQADLQAMQLECEALGAVVSIYPVDFASSEALDAFCATLKREHPSINILINNAGIFCHENIAHTSRALLEEQMHVNLYAPFQLSQHVLGPMRKQNRGDIVFVASVMSKHGFDGASAYAMAKHGLLGLCRCLRAETYQQGIRVITLLPGATATSSWDLDSIDETRLMPAEDIAKIILNALETSRRTVIEEIVARPQEGDIRD